MIGAGALGTAILHGIAPHLGRGTEVRIYDHNVVMPENLVFQAYEAEDVGALKAEASAAKLSADCDGEVRISPFPIRYEERPVGLRPPSVSICCGDSFQIRKHASDCSLHDGREGRLEHAVFHDSV